MVPWATGVRVRAAEYPVLTDCLPAQCDSAPAPGWRENLPGFPCGHAEGAVAHPSGAPDLAVPVPRHARRTCATVRRGRRPTGPGSSKRTKGTCTSPDGRTMATAVGARPAWFAAGYGSARCRLPRAARRRLPGRAAGASSSNRSKGTAELRIHALKLMESWSWLGRAKFPGRLLLAVGRRAVRYGRCVSGLGSQFLPYPASKRFNFSWQYYASGCMFDCIWRELCSGGAHLPARGPALHCDAWAVFRC